MSSIGDTLKIISGYIHFHPPEVVDIDDTNLFDDYIFTQNNKANIVFK